MKKEAVHRFLMPVCKLSQFIGKCEGSVKVTMK